VKTLLTALGLLLGAIFPVTFAIHLSMTLHLSEWLVALVWRGYYGEPNQPVVILPLAACAVFAGFAMYIAQDTHWNSHVTRTRRTSSALTGIVRSLRVAPMWALITLGVYLLYGIASAVLVQSEVAGADSVRLMAGVVSALTLTAIVVVVSARRALVRFDQQISQVINEPYL
jgi:hypothetical protein